MGFPGKAQHVINCGGAGIELAHPHNKPTIGLLLCRTKNNVMAGYALRWYSTPNGVAEWKTQIEDSLPEEFTSSLPSIELLAAEPGGGCPGTWCHRSPARKRATQAGPALGGADPASHLSS